MRVPGGAELIEAWESGRDQNAVQRALTLLNAAEPEATREQLQTLSLAERDRRLLQLRAGLFGQSLRAVWDCARCREKLEFALDVQELIARYPATEAPFELCQSNQKITFRKPNSEDLLVLLASRDPSRARHLIAERCTIAPPEPSQDIIERVAVELAARDSDSETVLSLDCAACGHHAEVFFDIASFVWSELQSLVRQLLEQVHALAWAYGWREQDILAMSAARRRFYLERVA